MEDIYRLALSNMATGLQDLTDRVAYLEGKQQPHQTAFDLERYRGLLKQRITNLKRLAEETYGKITYERYAIQIEAYEHALRLLDA